MATRPNEHPIKGRVEPFRESPVGIPGEEENLRDGIYAWLDEAKKGGQFSGKRNVQPLETLCIFLFEFARKLKILLIFI